MGIQQRYKQGIDLFMQKTGKEVQIQTGLDDCPNCGYDRLLNKSNGIYNAGHQDREATQNRRFQTGQQCPVCGGLGKIPRFTESLCIVNWQPKSAKDVVGVNLSGKYCEIKCAVEYQQAVQSYNVVRVKSGNQYIQCSVVTPPIDFGIGRTTDFVKFFAQAQT